MGNIIFAAFIKFRGYQVPAILISGAVGLSLLYYMLFVSQWILELNAGSRDDAFLTMVRSLLPDSVFDHHVQRKVCCCNACAIWCAQVSRVQKLHCRYLLAHARVQCFTID